MMKIREWAKHRARPPEERKERGKAKEKQVTKISC
jgi:hypothetical protein